MKDRLSLNENYKLSSKSFSRDIKLMQTVLQIPIKYDASRKGFYLTDRDWTDRHGAYAPSAGEIKLLLLGEHIARTFMPPQLREGLNDAVCRLLMEEDEIFSEGMELENFQVINPEFVPDVKTEIFKKVYEAWENKKRLKIKYSSRKDHHSQKTIEPQVLAWNAGIWYIKGFLVNEDGEACPPPYEIRVFALHRIEEAVIAKEKFFVDDEELKRIKKKELFNFETIDEVEIEFFPPFIKPMAERFSPKSDMIISQDENSLRVRLKDVPEYAVLRMVFNANGYARILKPARLQESLREIANRTLENMK
jgi:predicted DNA-binding transcriptional regulator YafY